MKQMIEQGTLTEGEGSVLLTSLYLLFWISSFYIKNIIYFFTKQETIIKEVNCTESSPPLSVPCGLHYKNVIILNDASGVVGSDATI